MNMHTFDHADAHQLIEETAVVLQLLAVSMAIIATPATPPLASKVLAVMAQNCASNWAAMLHAEVPTARTDAQRTTSGYTGKQVIDIELRLAKKGGTAFQRGMVAGTINTARAFGAIDEPTYLESFKRLSLLKSGGAQ